MWGGDCRDQDIQSKEPRKESGEVEFSSPSWKAGLDPNCLLKSLPCPLKCHIYTLNTSVSTWFTSSPSNDKDFLYFLKCHLATAQSHASTAFLLPNQPTSLHDACWQAFPNWNVSFGYEKHQNWRGNESPVHFQSSLVWEGSLKGTAPPDSLV